MNINKLLAILILVMIGAYVAPTLFLSIFTASQVVEFHTSSSDKVAEINQKIADERAFQKKYSMVSNLSMFEDQVRSFEEPDKVSKLRTINVSFIHTEATAKTLLKKSGLEPAHFSVALGVLANLIAREECDIIKAIFAEKCIVTSVTTKLSKGKKWGEVNAQIMFTSKPTPFSFDLSKTANYSTSSADLLGNISPEFSFDNYGLAKIFRTKIYKSASEICTDLTSVFGNCLINSLRIKTIKRSQSSSTFFQSISATGKFGYLQHDN